MSRFSSIRSAAKKSTCPKQYIAGTQIPTCDQPDGGWVVSTITVKTSFLGKVNGFASLLKQ